MLKFIESSKKKNLEEMENLYVIDDVKEAFNIINKVCDDDAYILLENDLPDIFNE